MLFTSYLWLLFVKSDWYTLQGIESSEFFLLHIFFSLALPTVGGQGGYCYIISNRVLRTGPKTYTTTKTRYRRLMGSPHVPCLFLAETKLALVKK